jgi:hypothetical protein
MKSFIALLVTIALVGTAYAEVKEKQICKDKKDKAGNVVKDKQGKSVQTCKTIKVRKKAEGTKIPEKK